MALGQEAKVVPVAVEEAAVTLAAQLTAAALGAAAKAKVRTLVALQSGGSRGLHSLVYSPVAVEEAAVTAVSKQGVIPDLRIVDSDGRLPRRQQSARRVAEIQKQT